MHDSKERDYLLLRAEQERRIASICADSSAALAHVGMANEYERRAAAMRDAPAGVLDTV